eukprot:CAMPEP_0172329288 /NCGR_PEP_ID=MMETSP1058-20130122/60803_1 /TAXON_ID=83371 /ORGANISM="Detonula confervacea, Strain CCMP 353" /LENGTH=989 /DNA_ID=CAMNT_0013046459 /DNA_START=42 /DNA_END=3011 /DNA_ORIENTATION=+
MEDSSSNRHNRRRHTDTYKSSEGSTHGVEMKTSKSYHGSGTRSAVKHDRSRPHKLSKSLTSAREDVSLHNRYCDVHPDVALEREEQCPECDIRLMKIAAKSLERRVAEMELERKGKYPKEESKKQTRKERKSVSSSSKSSDEKEVERQKETEALLRWSAGFGHGSAVPQPSGPRSEHRLSKSITSLKSRPRLSRQFSLGQVAQPSEIEAPSSRADSLIKIARLREGDAVWIKRSDNMWTYATLKTKENGPDATLAFTVNVRGSTKKFPMTHWAKYVRIVTCNHDDAVLEEEEDEIEMMMSDNEIVESTPRDKGKKSKLKVLEDDRDHQHSESSLNKGREIKAPRDKEKKSKGKAVWENDSDHQQNESSLNKEREIKAPREKKGKVVWENDTDQQRSESSSNKRGRIKAKVRENRRQLLDKSLSLYTFASQGTECADSSSSKGSSSRETNQDRGGVDLQDCEMSKCKLTGEKIKANVGENGQHLFEKSLDTFVSETTIDSADAVPSKDSPPSQTNQENGGGENLQDREMTVYTSTDALDDPCPQKEKHQDNELSMYTFGGSEQDVSDESCQSILKHGSTSEDDRLKMSHDHEVSMYTFSGGEQDVLGDSCQSVLNQGPTTEDDNPKHRVSFKMPQGQDQCQEQTLARLRADHDADAEESRASDASTGADKFKELFRRSVSLPNPDETPKHEEPNESPVRRRRRPQHKHRVSWDVEMDGIKEEMEVGAKKSCTKMPTINDPDIPKKELKEPCAEYDANATEPSASDAPTGADKFQELFRRSVSLPNPDETPKHEEPNESPVRRRRRPQHKHRVSWDVEMDGIKEEMEVGAKKSCTKMPTINDPDIPKKELKEPCAEYDANATEPSASDAPTGADKFQELFRRSVSLRNPDETPKHEEPNESPVRRRRGPQLKHRVSFTDDIDRSKEKIKVAAKKSYTRMPTINDPNIPKKKLKDLNMGSTRRGSFHSALKSMHKRSSVFLPPTSDVHIDLD